MHYTYMYNASTPFLIPPQQEKDARQKKDNKKMDLELISIFSWDRKRARRPERKKNLKGGYIIQTSAFALTSTQGVTSLPHNSTKSHHSATPITTTAFFIMLFHFPFGTTPCLSHPTGFYLKTPQRTVLSNAPTCITTTMTFYSLFAPKTAWVATGEQGSCHKDPSQQLYHLTMAPPGSLV